MARSKKTSKRQSVKQQKKQKPVEQVDEKMEEDSNSEKEGKELSADSDVDYTEKITMDFEALPPHESDLIGLVNLLTQIFLRIDIDCEGLAKKIIQQSPFGCVYKPTEECEDDEEGAEGLVYGTLSAVNLIGKEKYQEDIANFLIQKAQKHASKAAIQQLKKLLPINNSNEESLKTETLGLVVNEKMLHFPEQIAGPAFQSISEDIKNMSKSEQYQHVLLIVKVRVSEENSPPSSKKGQQPKKAGVRKKRLGKADKKRLAAAKLADAEVLFDNAEEELLFQSADALFQYPVHTDVEKTSKFHSTIRDGVTYRSYRRVCLLTIKEFLDFADSVTRMYSS